VFGWSERGRRAAYGFVLMCGAFVFVCAGVSVCVCGGVCALDATIG